MPLHTSQFPVAKGAFILAPLAGYTDLPFRLLCQQHGAAMTISEMVSCHGLVQQQVKTWELLHSIEAEQPFSVQLFGSDPEMMARAAALIPPDQADCIDINMGCPVRKVVKKGAGAALMRDMPRARDIIQAVCGATRLPVTIKCRSGWTTETINAPRFALMAEESGARAITIHGRTWAQGFGGQADWQVIRQVKEAVSIPIIGNGDVLCREDGLQMMEETGCDAVMIGRGALGNPWLFGRHERPESLAGRLPAINSYLDLAERHLLHPKKLLFRIRNHTVQFLSGLPNAAQLRQAVHACADIPAIRHLLANNSHQ